MLRIGICDDVKEMRFTLRAAVERILETRDVACEFYEFSSGDGLLKWFAKHAGKLDLLFLDIEMDGTDGMQTAQQLRQTGASLQIVFVTGYADYVFDGYGVGALGYLLKPPKPAQLEDVLLRALAALHLSAEQVFVLSNGEGTYRIAKSSILYFYSDKRLCTCVTQPREYAFYARLDDVAAEVGAGFVRIHQRYLVNAAAVDKIGSDTVTVGAQTLPISRAHRAAASLAIARAMLE